MHIVSYDEDDFNSVSDATSSRDGIAVLGILFTVCSKSLAVSLSASASLCLSVSKFKLLFLVQSTNQ